MRPVGLVYKALMMCWQLVKSIAIVLTVCSHVVDKVLTAVKTFIHLEKTMSGYNRTETSLFINNDYKGDRKGLRRSASKKLRRGVFLEMFVWIYGDYPDFFSRFGGSFSRYTKVFTRTFRMLSTHAPPPTKLNKIFCPLKGWLSFVKRVLQSGLTLMRVSF